MRAYPSAARASAACLALLCAAAAPALAQAPGDLQPAAEPAFGAHALPADDALALDVTLSSVAEVPRASCFGRIDPSRPDFVIGLDAPEPLLSFRASSMSDTTLVVVDPAGEVHCVDDTIGLDPAVTLRDAGAGDYAVWVGVWSGEGGEGASLAVTRDDPAGGGAFGGIAAEDLDHTAPPAAGLHVLADGGTVSVPLVLSGGAPASDLDWSCAGSIDPTRPDAVIRLDTDAEALHLRASSQFDTTLVVRTPDGALLCDDDTFGFDPAVSERPAPAGDYAVWVGVWSGPSGGAATLDAGFSEDDIGGAGTGAFAGDDLFGPGLDFDENPFEGRDLASAVEALEILMAEQGLGEVLAYDRLEPLGDDGFVLHGVTFGAPEGAGPGATVRMDRLRVVHIDLDSLAATGEPDSFSFALEGVDYRALVRSGAALGFLPPVLPDLDEAPPLSFSASLEPVDGDDARRAIAVALDLEGQFSVRVSARLDWQGAGGAPASYEESITRAMTVEFENRGFLGEVLRAQAAEAGVEPAEAVSMMLEGLAFAFDPIEPGSPQAQVLEVLGAALAAADRPGVIRLDLATDAPEGIEALFEDLEDTGSLDERLIFDLVYEPMP
jgi:hypothetical protein